MRPKTLTRRQFLKITGLSAAATFASGGASIAYGTQVEPWRVEIKPVELTLPRLAPEFDGFRLVHISDLHFDDVSMTRPHFDSIIDKVADQHAEAIVFTGDYVTQHASRFADHLMPALLRLAALAPTMSVLGNHDHWVNAPLLRELMRNAHIRELRNEVLTVERDRGLLHFCGVDDYMEHKDRLEQVLDKLPAAGTAILLVHEPDFADESAKTGRFDLQLSGHSHGGQVVIPFLGAPITPVLGRKYPSGQYKVGNMIQYTTRGLGMVPPRIRLNCRPEITVLTLRSRI